jgi:hypothetical protein
MHLEGGVAETSGFSTDLPQSAYLSLSIRRAISAAQQRSHRYVTLEHLLLALLDDPDAQGLLEAVGADIPAIRMSVADTVNRNLATLYTPGEFDLRASYKVERVLQSASDDADRLGCTEVDAAFVLAGLSRESDNPAADILKRNGFGYPSAMTWLYANRGVSMSRRPAPAAAAPAPAPAPVEVPAAEPAPASVEEAPASAAPALREESILADLQIEDAEEDDAELELEILDPEPEPEPAPPAKPPLPRTVERMPDFAPRAPGPTPQPAPSPKPAAARIPMPAPAKAPPPPLVAKAPAPPSAAPQEAAAADPYKADSWASPAAPPVSAPPPGLAPRRREPANGYHEPAKPAAAQPQRRPPEPQVPSASRLEEMRVRTGSDRSRAPLPAPVPAPPPPAALDKKARRGAKPAPAAAPAPAQAKAPTPAQGKASGPDRQKARQRRPLRPQEVLIGKLVENIPRRMRAAVAESVEVRISREETQVLARGMDGRAEPVRHELMVTQTMSVALRAPDGGFTIEPLSPETQWIFDRPESAEEAETYGRWRWVVTPHERGQRRLQVVVAARSIDQHGMVADTPLPDQVITVRVRTNYLRSVSRGLQWIALMLIGGVLTELALVGVRIFAGGGGE